MERSKQHDAIRHAMDAEGMKTTAPAIAANRFGLGARPGDLARMGSDPRGWLAEQLAKKGVSAGGAGLSSSADILSQAMQLRRVQRTERRRDTQNTRETENPQAPAVQAGEIMKIAELYRPIYVAEVTARLREAVSTTQPFLERLTHFWTNHFAVSVDKIAVLGIAGSFEREAIRPHVLGSFADLLLAVERHPAMLLYLDNHVSTGPNSQAARRAGRRLKRQLGINENLAREILELHTLGVDGGYTQADVTTLAKVISGWSIGGRVGGGRERGAPGQFLFRPELHEPGAQVVAGKRYSEGGYEQGEAVLHDLATHPSTGKHIATKLARHFISDDPPAAAVARLEAVFRETSGSLPKVYRALIEMPHAWDAPFAKYKTPAEYIISTHRALELPVQSDRRALVSFELLGQRTYAPGSPAGWPDRGSDWDGASALMKRIEWADAVGQRMGGSRPARDLAGQILGETVSAATLEAVSRAASAPQALTLLLTAPEFLRR